jgi:hypothetical protein
VGTGVVNALPWLMVSSLSNLGWPSSTLPIRQLPFFWRVMRISSIQDSNRWQLLPYGGIALGGRRDSSACVSNVAFGLSFAERVAAADSSTEVEYMGTGIALKGSSYLWLVKKYHPSCMSLRRVRGCRVG